MPFRTRIVIIGTCRKDVRAEPRMHLVRAAGRHVLVENFIEEQHLREMQHATYMQHIM
jgi:hypothetical protein